MRTWIDLPEHPNLAACRFFRTVDDQTLLFAEYVERGFLPEHEFRFPGNLNLGFAPFDTAPKSAVPKDK